MPQDNRLLILFLTILPRPPTSLAATFRTILLITKQVKSIHRPILITLPNLKLLRIVRKSAQKIIPVVQMIGIVMVRIKPGQIREFATLVQSAVVRGSFCFGGADVGA
jgi:hypothetical protein